MDQYPQDCSCEKCVKPRKYRNENLKNRYGITEDVFNSLLLGQKNKCKICGVDHTLKPLVVDHCHDSKAVRGLLCSKCNIGLGQFEDDPKLISQAIEYLNRSKGK